MYLSFRRKAFYLFVVVLGFGSAIYGLSVWGSRQTPIETYIIYNVYGQETNCGGSREISFDSLVAEIEPDLVLIENQSAIRLPQWLGDSMVDVSFFSNSKSIRVVSFEPKPVYQRAFLNLYELAKLSGLPKNEIDSTAVFEKQKNKLLFDYICNANEQSFIDYEQLLVQNLRYKHRVLGINFERYIERWSNSMLKNINTEMNKIKAKKIVILINPEMAIVIKEKVKSMPKYQLINYKMPTNELIQ